MEQGSASNPKRWFTDPNLKPKPMQLVPVLAKDIRVGDLALLGDSVIGDIGKVTRDGKIVLHFRSLDRPRTAEWETSRLDLFKDSLPVTGLLRLHLEATNLETPRFVKLKRGAA